MNVTRASNRKFGTLSVSPACLSFESSNLIFFLSARIVVKLGKRSNDRARDLVDDPAIERASDRAIDRANDRASDRAKRPKDRASDRPNHIIPRAADVRLTRCLHMSSRTDLVCTVGDPTQRVRLFWDTYVLGCQNGTFIVNISGVEGQTFGTNCGRLTNSSLQNQERPLK